MHELSLAMSLIEELEKILEREKARRAASVTVSLGELSGVDRTAFEFCYPFAVEGSRFKNTALKIVEIPAGVTCRNCHRESHPHLPELACTLCGCADVSVSSGRDFLISSVEIER